MFKGPKRKGQLSDIEGEGFVSLEVTPERTKKQMELFTKAQNKKAKKLRDMGIDFDVFECIQK